MIQTPSDFQVLGQMIGVSACVAFGIGYYLESVKIMIGLYLGTCVLFITVALFSPPGSFEERLICDNPTNNTPISLGNGSITRSGSTCPNSW